MPYGNYSNDFQQSNPINFDLHMPNLSLISKADEGRATKEISGFKKNLRNILLIFSS